jgi:DNA polymerase
MPKYVAIDYETFYDSELTLRNMTTEAYVRDKRFEVHCCGFCDPETYDTNGEVSHCDMAYRLRYYADAGYHFIAQNASFDGFICSHVFNVKPVYWIDTLSMARSVRGVNVSNSLAALAAAYNLPEKTVPYNLFMGKTKAELMQQRIMPQLVEGAMHDAKLASMMFNILRKQVTKKEMDLINLTIKMFTEPGFVCDIPLLEKYHEDELVRRAAALEACGVDESYLTSDKKFYQILLTYDVDVEMKQTAAGNTKPALAKTDPFMETLLHHENEQVRLLAEARIEARTSIKTTRAMRFIEAGRRGALPVALAYFGAQPGRWSSWDKLNMLNLPRGSALRRALEAPEGFDVVAVDLSQIELRVAMALAGMQEGLDEIASGVDPYCQVASDIYRHEVTKANKAERGLGKLLKLSGQYGAGWKSVQKTAQLGTYGPKIFLSDEQAMDATDVYRDGHRPILKKWDECHEVLKKLAFNDWFNDEVVYPGIRLDCTEKRLWLFERYAINYEGVMWDMEERQYKQATTRTKNTITYKRLWGSKIWQHIVQGVARIIMSDAAWRLSHLYKIPLLVHDEVVMFAPSDEDNGLTEANIALCVGNTVSYIPGLPIAYETVRGKRYEK